MAKLNIEIRRIAFRSIQEADINPQQMSDKDFSRLVKTFKKDGILTTTILVYEIGPDKYKCISGHHRIKAAIKAGIKEGDCMVLRDADQSTIIRLQLQHNDIHGEPDEALAFQLRQSLLEADLKLVASGMDLIIKDQTVKYNEPLYSYVHVCMMPESEKEFTQLLDRLDTEDSKKIILEKEEYALLKKSLTLAFKKGYKTPGKAMRQILDVYLQSNGNGSNTEGKE